MKRRNQFWFWLAVVGLLSGLARPANEAAAQEYRLRIGEVEAGGHELQWDAAGRQARYKHLFFVHLIKQAKVGNAKNKYSSQCEK